eukprot:858843-Pleurochrysis_carterae.AAC.1
MTLQTSQRFSQRISQQISLREIRSDALQEGLQLVSLKETREKLRGAKSSARLFAPDTQSGSSTRTTAKEIGRRAKAEVHSRTARCLNLGHKGV